MKSIDVLKALEETGAILKGHFKLTSGFHSGYYLQCAKLLQYPEKTSGLLDAALSEFGDKINHCEIETVISPAVGGILFGYLLAYKLGAKMIFTERKEKKMELRRGFELKQKEKVLIAEDVITTGGSVFEVIDICNNYGADIKGIISIVNRSEKFLTGLPFYYLIKIHIENFLPRNCPLCKENIEIYYPGSRK
ncbi:MAG: orotate phosphoribosyltransferase [Actinobacteria bacterium]|nr:orotate phosphoribosyltransferase [Actinomycetota bacterium]